MKKDLKSKKRSVLANVRAKSLSFFMRLACVRCGYLNDAFQMYRNVCYLTKFGQRMGLSVNELGFGFDEQNLHLMQQLDAVATKHNIHLWLSLSPNVEENDIDFVEAKTRFQMRSMIDDGCARARSFTSAVRRDMIKNLQRQRVAHNKRQLADPAFAAVFDRYEKTHAKLLATDDGVRRFDL